MCEHEVYLNYFLNFRRESKRACQTTLALAEPKSTCIRTQKSHQKHRHQTTRVELWQPKPLPFLPTTELRGLNTFASLSPNELRALNTSASNPSTLPQFLFSRVSPASSFFLFFVT
ncbi:hypothetical protein ISN45_Aa07g014410 [Arabidopsis thaliana x Arabidopsis arenosa]|uniref:Uncharacterized protein n=1 Tax=Arabidopsis thaliana x Arabidopsis arenosa TaxID=1240361 RepID=A0A8T1YBJ7_9BRAS|nr:hypothetical protein ISN45_Aa07g014410 [Arabidopsis thaliana x Arabidopsis arenosa]